MPLVDIHLLFAEILKTYRFVPFNFSSECKQTFENICSTSILERSVTSVFFVCPRESTVNFI